MGKLRREQADGSTTSGSSAPPILRASLPHIWLATRGSSPRPPSRIHISGTANGAPPRPRAKYGGTNRDDGARLCGYATNPLRTAPLATRCSSTEDLRPVDEQWGRLRGHSTNSAACRQALGGRPPGSAGRARRADQGTAAPARSAQRRSAPAPAAARTSLQSNPARSPAPSALPTTGRPAGAGRERRGSSSAPRRSTATPRDQSRGRGRR